MKYILVMSVLIIGFINPSLEQGACRPGECYRNHPQKIYCDSSVVMMVRVYSTVRDVRLNVSGYTAYLYNQVNAMVLSDFKPGSLEDGTSIEFYSPSSLCGTWFNDGEEYLITGSAVVDPSNGEELVIMGNCDRGLEWDDLSEKQQKGFEVKYGRFCECQITGVKSSVDLRLSLQEGGSGYVPAQSYWTPYRNCYYNPMKSESFELDDCEDKFGFCRPAEEPGVCSWQLTEEYLSCFEQREAAVFALEGAGAITEVDQCLAIPNRRKRKACIKAFRRSQRELASK